MGLLRFRTALRPAAVIAVLSALAHVAVAPPAWSQARSACDDDIARLRKAESELPRVSVAPPADRQILCITLETNLLFAQRLAAHLKQCPRSPFMRVKDSWVKASAAYTAQFAERACRPAIKS